MLLSAPQHYPRKGTCTRHGNLRPIIPVTSRPRAEMRSRVGWDSHSHVLSLRCAAKLCHGPRAGVGLVQRMGGLQLGRSMHTGQQEYNHAMSASVSINRVVDEDTQTAVFVDVPLYTGLFAGSPRNGWMGSLSKICCSLCLLACLLAAGWKLWPWIHAHPTDHLTPHVHAGMESLIVARALLIREFVPHPFPVWQFARFGLSVSQQAEHTSSNVTIICLGRGKEAQPASQQRALYRGPILRSRRT